MAQEVIMPQMGESLAEGTITKWIKKVGDRVERDEPLFEISTDKVDAEIPSPAAGVLLEIKFGEGQTVPVNTVVGMIGAAGDAPAAIAPAAPAAPSSAVAAALPVPSQPAAIAAPSDGETPRGEATPEELRRQRSSPVVRKIAAEHGVDIATLPGTGISGRVTKKDILGFIEHGSVPARTTPTPAVTPAPASGATGIAAGTAGAGGLGAAIPDLRIPAYAEGEPVVIEPMSVMRRKIADHMLYSQTIAAHVTSFFDVDFETVAREREALKPSFAQKGVSLTYMPFIIRAIVDGLQRHPYVNASVMGDKIVLKKEINIGIAVALEEGKGLIVPVIRHADEMNLLGLARAVNDLGERARTKRLSPDDVQRGTFSITNPGVYGGLMGTPIINQPQVAILGVGAIEKRPVVINDAIAIRHRAYLSLSYDHRLVDGAMAESFMAHVKKFLEAGSIQ